ncbi:MAG: hypothetical protein JWN83_2590 [Chitinophagaceae bacterium]|nr:hypothetical protein [Chitinophagaceae bacterium]
MNKTLLNHANQDWDNFLNGLSDEQKQGLLDFAEPISSNKLIYYASVKDVSSFDLTISKLSKTYLYEEQIIPTVYNFYIERELHELAFDYINKSVDYLNDTGKIISPVIQDLSDNSGTTKLFQSLKNSLINLRSLQPKYLPLITPDIVNDKRALSEFILNEIVQASKVLVDKIHGIKKIPDEDRFNDLLLAILRLRFQVWAWSIHDQARTGSSPTGKSAGETDITIQSGNITIALFEALILKGKNKGNTQKHILKCFKYAKSLERYYMIIYYKGAPKNFDKTWTDYKSNVSSCSFPAKFKIDLSKDFEDLSMKFDDVRHLKIAKSTHDKDVEMFHIMIDLSE